MHLLIVSPRTREWLVVAVSYNTHVVFLLVKYFGDRGKKYPRKTETTHRH